MTSGLLVLGHGLSQAGLPTSYYLTGLRPPAFATQPALCVSSPSILFGTKPGLQTITHGLCHCHLV